jgi:uncharacterized protein (DUF4415 family)
VVHTDRAGPRGEIVRIISARKATRHERRRYETETLSDAERQEQIDRLMAMTDDEIDLSDIPEITEEQWKLARRGAFYRPVKRAVTIRLDADVLAWFKERAEGRGYQTEINRVLRQHVARSENSKAG